MTQDLKNCPNCNKSLTGMFSAQLLPQEKVDFIKARVFDPKDYYCTSCGDPILKNIAEQIKGQRKDIQARINEIIHFIPTLSSPAPAKWDYEIIDMVSTQVSTGTGFLSELSMGANDFWGSGSRTINKKIDVATRNCMNNLRAKCIRLGGNAIVSCDIDYSEIGTGATNMLMVCMAGTAIRVKDNEYFNVKNKLMLLEINDLADQLEAIEM